MSDTVLLNKENGIGYITFNRPDKYNSFNREMALAFQAHLDDCANDDSVRCIYVTGAGKGFCAGQDLAEAADPKNVDFEKIVSEHYNPIIARLRNIEKPIVAAVNGVAAGAGANLALACDIVVASQSASFMQAFIKIGLIPDSAGTFFLPRYVGMQRAAALMMLGEKVSADEAVTMGMIYKSFPDDSFEADSKALATQLAGMPTKGIGLTKRLLNSSYSNNLHEQVEMEMRVQVEAGNTHDFVEGVNAFLEKRKPEYKGK
ncbi:MAG: enoyl-CoA hydratase/isomerase family protein [Chitinophagales bacterium]|nr:enoyl-CoA hydratase/isomerase family protein [Chitinophagaceae bacterium]MCB9064082.1 enoyl-CoA hydratase/isomerase family protein [Chitinophagales bacterium]